MTAQTPPLRFVQVGAGGMGRAWLDALRERDDIQVTAIVDIDERAAASAARDAGLADALVTDTLDVALERGADAVLNVTVPEAHHAISTAALFAGVPVLSEKPVAPTVAQGLSLAAASDVTGRLLMVSQSRRYYPALRALRERVRGLGDLGLATTDFFKAPHFGGFREQMPHVLLVDMAIHAFDASRYLLEREPVSVICEEFNPSWSWYRADAAAVATFEFEGGLRYRYTGSWASDGLETSWNGSWRVNGAGGTATWDGERTVVAQGVGDDPVPVLFDHGGPREFRGALDEFVTALRTGETPSGEVHSNLVSLAMVEAAVRSAELGRRVRIDEVLDDAHAAALAAEKRPEVAAALPGALAKVRGA